MIDRTPDIDDLDREIRDHLDAETDDNIARGMSAHDARAAAIRKFGNVTRVKEDVRGVWVPGWIDGLRQDARDAIRHVRRNPAFSLAIILTLTLGIGLTTAIYSVVQAVLLKPLAYPNPDRVVWLTTSGKDGHESMNSIDFAAWRSQVTSLEHIVAYDNVDSTIFATGVEASRIRIVSASEGFWQVSGAQPLLGALPTEKDPQVLVLTHRFFRAQFGGDPQVIGRAVTIDGRQATIGAVLPEDFQPQLLSLALRQEFDRVNADAYRVMVVQPPPREIGPMTQVRIYQAIGELKPGVTIGQARAEIETIHTVHQREQPTPFGVSAAVVVPLRDKIVGPSRLALGVLLSAAVFVLLITCANVANLLLSRSAERRKEIALRMSIGSGPLRVIRQLLAESAGYALLGGVGGVLLASWLVNTVVSLIGPAVPRLTEATLDIGVLAVAAGISLGTALLFGVGPAIALVFTNAQEALKEGGRSASASRRVMNTGRAMVMVQVALTVMLLTGAGLMSKSVWQMTTYPPGFAPDQILTMRVDFRGPQYRELAARRAYATALLTKAQSLPGVREAAVTSGRESTMLVIKEGEALPLQNREGRAAPVSRVSANFGRLVGMSIVSGRWLNDVEMQGAIVINETLARRDFHDSDPIGARIRVPWLGENGLGTIVGVAADVKYAEIDADTKPELFFHYADTPIFGVTVVMRTDGDPIAAAPEIRKALSSLDPTQSFYSVRTMETALAESIAPRRFNLLLLGTFALVALVLAALGVYGVVSYSVAERTREIGIRLALGAERARVVRMIVGHGMLSVTAGIIVGLAGSMAATRWIAGLLYGVQPTDAPTFTTTTMMLAAVAFIACAAPALKAARVDPIIALRAE